MPRDLYLWACNGDSENICTAEWESYRVEYCCPECGSPDIELVDTHYYVDKFGDR